MEPWMIAVAIAGALIIVFVPVAIKKFKKSSLVTEVKSGVQAVQAYKDRYPTPEDYETDVIRELRIQGADEHILQEVLQEAYEMTIVSAHRSGEDPAHFVDRWLYSVTAPRRWDFIEGLLPFYFLLVQELLDKKRRPTPVIKQAGGAQSFIHIIESEFARGITPEALAAKYFMHDELPPAVPAGTERPGRPERRP